VGESSSKWQWEWEPYKTSWPLLANPGTEKTQQFFDFDGDFLLLLVVLELLLLLQLLLMTVMKIVWVPFVRLILEFLHSEAQQTSPIPCMGRDLYQH